MRDILQSDWFFVLKDQQQKLVTTAVELYERESLSATKLEDYSFIVFPISKAYEGFLKQRFLEMQLIDKKTFEGHRFRIGKALNPDINERSRDKYWLFDDFQQLCGTPTALALWDTWLVCRNRVFHFYPKADNTLSLETAGNYLLKVSNSMKLLVECQIESEEDTENSNNIYEN